MNDKKLAQKYFTQGLLTLFLLAFLLIFPFVLYSREIIAGIGFDKDNARLVSRYLSMFAPITLISCVNDFLMSYCISEGVEAHFHVITYSSLAVSCLLMYFLCFVGEYLVEGWMISRLVFFLLTFIGYFRIYRGKTDKETQGLVTLS